MSRYIHNVNVDRAVILCSYSGIVIKLVVDVAGIKKRNKDKLLVAIVVAPVSNSGGDGKNVTLSEMSKLLVAVRLGALALSLSLSLLGLFESLGASRESDS